MSHLKLTAILLLGFASLDAQTKLNKLPDWAQPYAQASITETAPADADAWVLLDRTEFAYVGNGEIRRRHFRLVKVLTEQGLGEGVHALHGFGGNSSRIKKLKGWNLRPDDTVTKVDRDDVVLFDTDQGGKVSTGTISAVALDSVVKGSFVAFESQEVTRLIAGAAAAGVPMEAHPVRHWELEFASEGGWFSGVRKPKDLRIAAYHFEPWLKTPALAPYQAIRLENIPPLPKHEAGHPPFFNVLPRIELVCVDDVPGMPSMENWDAFAAWYADQFRAKATALPVPGAQSGSLEGLKAASQWMSRELTYKQVYLTPERGWIPEESGEVARKRYGDCKDLTSCLVGVAAKLGFKAYPTLALISDGHIEPRAQVFPYLFNHVITAIRLDKSLALPSEVETPRGRMLLVDPTSRLTQIGFLPSSHRSGRVLICTEEGAAWVDIPDRAIEPTVMHSSLEGSVDAGGRFKGWLNYREEGDAWDLRTLALQASIKDLEKKLLGDLNLPTYAKTSLDFVGDPLDLSKPFEMKLSLDVPESFRPMGGDMVLRNLGLPGTPEAIQKLGVARQYPVHVEGGMGRTFDAVITFDRPYAPVTGEANMETAFRRAKFNASSSGNKVTLHFEQTRITADFPYSQQEEGVKQQRKDRNAIKRLVDDALSFKPGL